MESCGHFKQLNLFQICEILVPDWYVDSIHGSLFALGNFLLCA
jgi:hypothetical protein